MSQIFNNLYLSSIVYAKDKYWLNKNNIKYILIIGSLPQFFPHHFKYKQIMIEDSKHQNIQQYFQECINYIDESLKNNHKILVHCYGGQSRSVTIIIAYVMNKKKLDFKQAYNYVKQLHPRAEPNPGFVEQLIQFEILCK